jgi:hypothetical protein
MANLPNRKPNQPEPDSLEYNPTFVPCFRRFAKHDRKILLARFDCDLSLKRFFAERLLERFDPFADVKIQVASNKEMHVIRHNHVTTHEDVVITHGVLAKTNKFIMDGMGGQNRSSPVCTESDEINRGSKRPRQPQWSTRKSLSHKKSLAFAL